MNYQQFLELADKLFSNEKNVNAFVRDGFIDNRTYLFENYENGIIRLTNVLTGKIEPLEIKSENWFKRLFNIKEKNQFYRRCKSEFGNGKFYFVKNPIFTLYNSNKDQLYSYTKNGLISAVRNKLRKIPFVVVILENTIFQVSN